MYFLWAVIIVTVEQKKSGPLKPFSFYLKMALQDIFEEANIRIEPDFKLDNFHGWLASEDCHIWL